MRKKTEPFLMLPYRLLDDERYLQLSDTARTILHLYMRHANRYKPSSPVKLPYNYIQRIYKYSDPTITKSIKELVGCNLLLPVSKGGLGHQPSTYLVSWMCLGLEPSDYDKIN